MSGSAPRVGLLSGHAPLICLEGRHPLGQHRDQPAAPGAVGRLPYLLQPRRQSPGILSRRSPCIGPPCPFHLDGTQCPDPRLAAVAKQFNRLIDELPAMLAPCILVAPSQYPQHLLSRPRTLRLVGAGDGNRTFGATPLSAPGFKPLAGNKYSRAIRRAHLDPLRLAEILSVADPVGGIASLVRADDWRFSIDPRMVADSSPAWHLNLRTAVHDIVIDEIGIPDR